MTIGKDGAMERNLSMDWKEKEAGEQREKGKRIHFEIVSRYENCLLYTSSGADGKGTGEV